MATLDAITAYFPDKTLTPLSSGTDEPTYASIKTARDELNGNAASIPSLRGGGIHGHLALTLTDAKYLQIANEAFDAPVHPGPLVYTANATGPQQVEQARLYKLNLEEFRVYLAVNQALRNQLLASVNPTYLLAVKDPILGFGQITCLALITHLRTVYGIITPMMLTQNKKKMAANWHPPTPIEDLFEQLRVGMEFAIEGGDAMSVQEQVRLGSATTSSMRQGSSPKRAATGAYSRQSNKPSMNSRFISRSGIVTAVTPIRQHLLGIMGQIRQ